MLISLNKARSEEIKQEVSETIHEWGDLEVSLWSRT